MTAPSFAFSGFGGWWPASYDPRPAARNGAPAPISRDFDKRQDEPGGDIESRAIALWAEGRRDEAMALVEEELASEKARLERSTQSSAADVGHARDTPTPPAIPPGSADPSPWVPSRALTAPRRTASDVLTQEFSAPLIMPECLRHQPDWPHAAGRLSDAVNAARLASFRPAARRWVMGLTVAVICAAAVAGMLRVGSKEPATADAEAGARVMAAATRPETTPQTDAADNVGSAAPGRESASAALSPETAETDATQASDEPIVTGSLPETSHRGGERRVESDGSATDLGGEPALSAGTLDAATIEPRLPRRRPEPPASFARAHPRSLTLAENRAAAEAYAAERRAIAERRAAERRPVLLGRPRP
jgi:hypothetical protein